MPSHLAMASHGNDQKYLDSCPLERSAPEPRQRVSEVEHGGFEVLCEHHRRISREMGAVHGLPRPVCSCTDPIKARYPPDPSTNKPSAPSSPPPPAIGNPADTAPSPAYHRHRLFVPYTPLPRHPDAAVVFSTVQDATWGLALLEAITKQSSSSAFGVGVLPRVKVTVPSHRSCVVLTACFAFVFAARSLRSRAKKLRRGCWLNFGRLIENLKWGWFVCRFEGRVVVVVRRLVVVATAFRRPSCGSCVVTAGVVRL